MTLTAADQLGRLSYVIRVPRDFNRVSLFCYSCAREDFTSPEIRYQVGEVLQKRDLIKQGIEVVEFAHHTSTIGLIFPFDPLAFRAHLLHEVRPEIDTRYIGKPITVQDLTRFTKKKLSELHA